METYDISYEGNPNRKLITSRIYRMALNHDIEGIKELFEKYPCLIYSPRPDEKDVKYENLTIRSNISPAYGFLIHDVGRSIKKRRQLDKNDPAKDEVQLTQYKLSKIKEFKFDDGVLGSSLFSPGEWVKIIKIEFRSPHSLVLYEGLPNF